MSGAAGGEWYAGGLRFACTRCGNCCTGPPGSVWFTDEEGAAMARSLEIEPAEFYRRYAHKVDGRWSLTETLVDGRYDCVFLDRTSGAGLCSVYEDRPTQCRTWPFWPENLVSRRAWNMVKRRTPCPGMDEGPLVPIERIRVLRDTT